MKQKIMLISGCSHTSGSEIDGTEDSSYNRTNSYGNILANKLGYTPINIAEGGSTNPTITRSILQWFSEKYDAETMDVFVLVGWTEFTRMEVPHYNCSDFKTASPNIDYYPTLGDNYLRVNLGWKGGDATEKEFISMYHRFMAENESYLGIVTLNCILQLQFFLKLHSIDYVMCNAMTAIVNNRFTEFYISQIDSSKYMGLHTDVTFYWKYRNEGYVNPKAKYWHHNEIPHCLFAEELNNFKNDHQ